MLEESAASQPGATDQRPAARRGRGGTIALVVAVVLLFVAAAVGGLQLRSQHDALSRSQRTVAALQQTQDADRKAAKASSTALKAAQAQLSALATQLTSVQNQLKADEQQLKLTASQLPPDLTKLASQVSPSVVLISCGGSLGSGFVFDLPAARGYASVVVTAEHVVTDCVPGQGAGQGTGATTGALTITHEGQSVPAHLRSADPGADVALIDLGTRLPALEPATAPKTGDFVMAVGNPLGLTNNVTQGNVSQVHADYFLNTAPISNGNSGGPLVDRSGRVLGIADASYAASVDAPVVENLNVAVRLARLCSTLLSGPVCTNLN